MGKVTLRILSVTAGLGLDICHAAPSAAGFIGSFRRPLPSGPLTLRGTPVESPSKETMSISVDHEKKRILFAQWGVLDRESAMRSYRVIHSVVGFDPSYDTLVDYTGLVEVALGADDLKPILEEARKIERRSGRAALVVGKDLGRLMFAKLFCLLADAFGPGDVHYAAYKTTAEAEAWLAQPR